MNSYNRFGVIIPTRNRSGCLRRAVRSVRRQDFRDWRLVIVDDASDSTHRNSNKATADQDPRIHFAALGRHRGAAHARNHGAAQLRVEYLVFMDDDCWWPHDRLSTIDSALRRSNPPARQAYTRMVTLKPDGEATVHGRLGNGVFTGGWRVGTPMLVVESARFQESGGFDPRLPRFQDFDLALRLMLIGESLFIPGTVVWADDSEGISTDRTALRVASRTIADKYRRDPRLPRQSWAFMHRELGYRLMTLDHRSEALRHYSLAIMRQPEKPVHWASFMAALAGRKVYRLLVQLAEGIRQEPDALHEVREWSPAPIGSSPQREEP